ncbi:MAG: carbohydrate binding family 9 domain-containing protein [Acidobacteria bacterium]|nr:carbohydrate binding family 9 domain-containing protein [Acidobacteriota bacterium]
MIRLARAAGIVLWTLPGIANAAAAQSPPVQPAVFTRDPSTGRATIQAVRLSAPLHIDGHLDETVYTTVPPISDFIQMEPRAGEAATEKTEVWVFFDQHAVYVAMRAWESRPDLMVANEMRRDSNNIRMGDCVGFSLDTFHDGRNAYQFEVNPLGARTDGQSANERQYNSDWNPVWDLAVGRFAGGWTVEAAIPFKSLRYRPGTSQVWGFNARRNNKWKNEISFLARVPAAYGIGRGSFAASLFPTLNGIDAPPRSRNIEVKPYVVADLTTDHTAAPAIVNHPDGDVGLDVKYGLTQSLTADLTYNTDFAQVEADEQQVNLTRFSLFFPEKREFFLENQGTFAFGASATTGASQPSGDTPLLFYSRRIGLNQIGNQGLAVPILAGGRLTGRAGRFSIGAIDIGTRDAPKAGAEATNFSVLRLRRDILRRSAVGVMATTRSAAQSGTGSNDAYGVDGTFAFFANLSLNTYWAKTRTPGLTGRDTSYRAQMEYAGDRYGLQLDRLVVGDAFNPEVGYVRRRNIRESFGQVRFSPRPNRIKSVRKFSGIGTYTYVEDSTGSLQTRTADGEFAIELQNSDRFSVGLLGDFERLAQPFAVTPAAKVPVGAYDFAIGRVGYTFGQQRPVSGNLLVERGAFYNGHRTSVGFSRTRVNLSPRFSLEPNVSINWIDLPDGSFATNLVGSRVTYTMTPLMFVSALVQYNSTTRHTSANVRLRWEYRPGSELFVVYNEERETLTQGFSDLQNGALIVKVNRLFRF